MQSATTICWPGGGGGPDPWDDGAWPSLIEAPRFAPLVQAWQALRLGLGSHAELARAAAACGVDGPPLEDRNRPPWGLPCPSLDELIRIAADHWPAVGMDGPDIVLGPRSVFASREERRVAVAGCAFVWTEGWPQSSFGHWCRGKPIPAAAERARLRAVGLAPWAVWRVVGGGPGAWRLADHSGLGAFYQPDGPVRVIGQAPTGEGLIARVLRVDDGWVAHTALDLPVLPPREHVEAWIVRETWMARAVQPGVTRASLLRKRPTLARRSLEAWASRVL